MARKGISFRAQMGGELRTNTLYGKDHLVVPVVALVEGVLQAMNAATPELALASEFGKFPASWNGRPVVMNHPVINNVPVSANDPGVLETYAFGYLFNTTLEDGKLKTEAWIDLDRVSALGGDVESTIDRINNGEIVEVSTGLFTDVDEVRGNFNGKAYGAVWRGVVPDHLAFLSEGSIGACSVEAGCGTRANSSVDEQSPSTWAEYTMPKDVMADDEEEKAKKAKTMADGTLVLTNPTTPCSCGNHSVVANADGEHTFDAARLIANAMPEGMLDTDARKLVTEALRKQFSGYCYVIGLTPSKAIFERWDNFSDRYATWQVDVTVNEDKTITFGGEPQEVILTTQITPKVNQESDMTDKSKEGQAPAEPKANTTTTPALTTEPVVLAAPAPAAPKTLNQYLADMPKEMSEMLTAGMRLHNSQKAAAIKALQDTGRCKFSTEALSAMSLDDLHALSELAAVPTFEAVATPRANDSGNMAPPAPTL